MIYKLILALLMLLTVVQLGSRVFHAPLEFDESYNLLVVQNLAESGRYATNDRLLDIQITTGPTVLAPAALAYPIHPLAPRIIIVLYAVIFIATALKYFFTSNTERVVFLVFINLTPLYFLFSTQVVGEVPGFALLFLSYLLFARAKYGLAGLFLGLSVLTKSVYVLGAMPIIVLVLRNAYAHQSWRKVSHHSLRFILAAAIPFIIWEVVKWGQLGFNIGAYQAYADRVQQFAQEKGSAEFSTVEGRIDMLGYVFPVGGFLFTFLSLHISAFTYLKSKRVDVGLVSLFAATHFLYFLFLGATDWYRHLFPAILALTLIAPVFISLYLQRLTFDKKLILGVLAIIVLFIPIYQKHRDQNQVFIKKLERQNLLFLDQTNKPYRRKKLMLEDQYAMRDYIKNNVGEEAVIAGPGWFNSPEIAYLTNRTIQRDVKNPDVTYIISSIYDRTLSNQAATDRGQLPLKKVYGNSTYEIFIKQSNP